MERYIPVPQTRPKPPRAWLLFLQAGYKRAVLGTTILSNGKEHFAPTDRNDQTGQRGPPSKLVPNIPLGPNRNGPFHLMYQPKLPEFWVEWKAPHLFSILAFLNNWLNFRFRGQFEIKMLIVLGHNDINTAYFI